MKVTQLKNMQAIIFLVISCWFGLQHSYAQNAQDAPEDKKNSLYISYGNILYISQVSFSYERLLFTKDKLQTRAKLSYGNHLTNHIDHDVNAEVTEDFLGISVTQLAGRFEINAGLAYINYTLSTGIGGDLDPNIDYDLVRNKIRYYGNIGFRYAKNGFLFRAGVGSLELLYVGIGLNF